MNLITKEELVEILETIARLLELKGENAFKVRAYQNAARAVETYSGNLERATQDGALTEIPGIGKAIAEKIKLLCETGRLPYFDELKAEFPPGLFELFELQGLGGKRIGALYSQLGIASIEQLEAACKDGRVAALAGFGGKTATNICQAIEQRQSFTGSFTLGDVAAVAEEIYSELRDHPDVSQVAICGSYRRRKEVVHDLDFLVASPHPAEMMDFFATLPQVESIIMKGPTKSSVRLKGGLQADLRVVSNGQYPFALNYFTGSKEHNIVMRGRALSHGWTLNEYRLSPVEGATAPTPAPEISEERDLYHALGLDYVEPELRENQGEFAAAEEHRLPNLVTLSNLRGTFHNHTVASDGRSTLEEMVDAAHDLGLQYFGIADHSKSSVQAHGLDEARLFQQVEEIARLNATFPQGSFRIFSGCECDILKDGSLDFSDEVLGRLDYVVASIHAVFNLPEAEMTARIIKAISNPNVTFMGHLTGRLLLSRKGYAVDVPAVIEAAAATGTIIELNANPRRLDMDWHWWPLAKEKGVRCVINPDAHHTSGLKHLWFGVAAARTGWLTREDVVNCLPLGKIEAVLEKKRRLHLNPSPIS